MNGVVTFMSNAEIIALAVLLIGMWTAVGMVKYLDHRKNKKEIIIGLTRDQVLKIISDGFGEGATCEGYRKILEYVKHYPYSYMEHYWGVSRRYNTHIGTIEVRYCGVSPEDGDTTCMIGYEDHYMWHPYYSGDFRVLLQHYWIDSRELCGK